MGRRMRGMFAIGLAVLGLCVQARAAGEPVKGQEPITFAKGYFQFAAGTWANYDVYELKSNTQYKLYFAVTERTKKGKTPAAWMEIGVQLPGQSNVITRVLAEETPDGPGRVFDVVVQIAGYSPFRVPAKYFKGEKKEAAKFEPVAAQNKLSEETIEWKGRTLKVWNVESVDAQGRKTQAKVSEEVPPLGIVTAETPETRMVLDTWGTGAKTQIQGAPRSMCMWIFELIGKSCSGSP